MPDLERHWDDLPVGPAPVDAILREAHRGAPATTPRTAHHVPGLGLRRSLTRVAVLGGVAAAFVAGSVVAQPDAPEGPGSRQAGPAAVGDGSGAMLPVAFHGELQAPASCADLLDQYRDRGLDLVGRFGWDEPYRFYRTDALSDKRVRLQHDAAMPFAPHRGAGAVLDSAAKGVLPRTSRADSSDTGTNVQEAGVDEPDSVKTDGTLLVRLRGAELTTYDVSGPTVDKLGSLDLGDFHDGEILLAGDTVVAIGNDGTRASANSAGYSRGGLFASPTGFSQTRVLTVDVADPETPTLSRTVDYDAGLLAARQHGDDVRLVLSKALPALDFKRGGRDALAANRKLVEHSTIQDWLPQVSVDGGAARDLLDCDRVAVPRAAIGLGTTAVVGFGATSPGDLETFGLAGDAPLSYESTDHLYLAASPSSIGECFDCRGPLTLSGRDGNDGTTHVYGFRLDGTGASYLGAGEVEGTIRDRWSMDEVDGVLRVAVGPSSETGNFNSIVTLRPEGNQLVEIGRLDRLGVGEQIQAVRWFDGLALLVTYRQTDPLFAVDLTDQTHPTLLGELKIPGFSSYLHPLGPRRVVGVGTGPQAGGGTGAQAGLFDLTDVTSPRQLDVTSYGPNSWALAGQNPRQFTWLPGRRIALTVIERGRSGYVSRLQLGGGRMANQMTQVEFGRDIAQVRLVPVSDERVVLVTGEDVKSFDLG